MATKIGMKAKHMFRQFAATYSNSFSNPLKFILYKEVSMFYYHSISRVVYIIKKFLYFIRL